MLATVWILCHLAPSYSILIAQCQLGMSFLVTPLVIFPYTLCNKYITKWLFWNCLKSYKEVSHAYQLLVICLYYCRSWAEVGSDISTSLKMTSLQSWSIDFFLFLCSEIEEKINAPNLKTCQSKASGYITTNFGSRTLDNHINKWPKVGKHD